MKNIDSFDFKPGRVIAKKYEVLMLLGKGWEGEVYQIKETRTGIERAAKLFYPQRNINNKTSMFYAKKLHKLRHCPILIQYHTEEVIAYRGQNITVLISEFVEGVLLETFLSQFKGKRMPAYQGLHLLYALIKGIEQIHLMNEYHGDLHTSNIIVTRFGLEFTLKLLDFYDWKAPSRENRREDICDAIRIFYDCVGGAKYYARQPKVVKEICCGLKRSLIFKKFRNASQLRECIELLDWEGCSQ